MHPTLSEEHYEGCESIIRALAECHAGHPIRKFFGVCNYAKARLDACLADEYLVRRELNAEKFKAEKARLKELLKDNNLL